MKEPNNYDEAKDFLDSHNVISEKNDVLFTALLMLYFSDNKEVEDYGISLDKGLLVNGNTGVGKTRIMELLSRKYMFFVVSTPHVVNNYINHGIDGLENYAKFSYMKNSDENYDFDKPVIYCFDDLGCSLEQIPAYYMGNKKNVMAEILYFRYQMNLPTHLITTLDAEELKKKYGKEVVSRMLEMVNEIEYQGNSKR